MLVRELLFLSELTTTFIYTENSGWHFPFYCLMTLSYFLSIAIVLTVLDAFIDSELYERSVDRCVTKTDVSNVNENKQRNKNEK